MSVAFKTQFSSAGLDASKAFENKAGAKLDMPQDKAKPKTSKAKKK